MSVREKYVPFGGGLDNASSAKAVKPGRLSQCLNFEEVFGTQGYRSIVGYERFDGRTSPSSQGYSVQAFDAGGTTPIAVADIVTGTGGASGEVVSVTLTSGSWAGGDAAGTLIITLLTGTWADNDAIQVSAVTLATASADTVAGVVTDADYETNLDAALDVVRADIQKPTGEGAILGVAVYRATVYCVRNVVGSASATLWKSSASGWTSVQAGLIPSGAWKFDVANFSGASTTLALFGVDGKNRLFKYDGTTFTKAAPIYGSEATSTSNVTIGTGAKTFTVAEASRNYVVGSAITIWSTASAANSMVGLVTAYNSGTGQLDVNVTSVTGSGTIASWEIGLTNFEDKPFLITEHKDHLFLGYPLGQLQTSNLGDPMVYTSTAASFGLGSELTHILSLKGAVLGIFCREKIELLTGTSATDWAKEPHSKNVGAIANTVADSVGNAFFLDDKGVMSLQSTQSFGDFESAVLSRDIKAYIDSKISTVVGARMVKGSNQYRLYFADGSMARFTIRSAAAVLDPRDVSPTRQTYIHIPTCFAAGVMADDEEALFFGTSDGYVMQEDKGTSFDGTAIDYVMRLPFNHYDSPSSKKRFHKLEFELDSPDALDISFLQLFDYDDGHAGHSIAEAVEATATGGQFDVSLFDTFQFDLPIHSRVEVNVAGVGRSMALLVYVTSGFVRPFTLQGLTTQFTLLGFQR